MKQLCMILALGIGISTVFAQKVKETEVPPAAKSAFQKLYPNATEVKWEKEGGNYEVNFDANNTENSVVLDESGKVLETEVEIEVSALPAAIVDYVNKQYKGAKVKEAAKITDAEGVLTYEAEVKGVDLLFDSTGKFIKEEKD